ncbi:50S ribosomal protein L2 [Patescibacteria group bacterium]|nr:50S ribosomal protein L2 [Patescibacteria group bacterium]MBU3999736.1 50S ribosomal protein L2 [Patescibacteria group bacterium]MBU4056826.1 50S ribosomal protein L2 [Patescibacteria group bacterium]MBU4369038.1 50S ribosomal protein L2 [Patescibacteria group bacterium]
MAIKEYKPTTPGRRQASVIKSEFLAKKRPEKALTFGRGKKSGRAAGKISVRHIGGGAKQLYRLIDWGQDKINVPAKVAAIEYDPNRSAHIALLHYNDGEKRYILSPEGMKAGDEVITAVKAPIKIGNRMILKNIPAGTNIYNIEMIPNKGGQLAKTAGSAAILKAVESGFAQVALPSGEIRMIPEAAWATIGQVSNPEYRMVKLGKAGRSRWLGVRPAVRGSAMNPVDHPHGGGEGRQPIGLKHPKTPWGKPAMGKKTRKKGKLSEKFIIKHRR